MSSHTLRWSVLLAALLVVAALALGAVSPSGASSADATATAISQHTRLSDRLYFGRKHPGGIVSDAEWATFLADVVTPRFPQGLTVWAADGQWRDGADRINREPTFVLEIVHAPQAETDTALKAIVAEYRRRFAQESVFWVRNPVEVVD